MSKIIDAEDLLKDAEDFVQAIWPLVAIPAEVWTAFAALAAGGLLILVVYILNLWGK
jgi:hypothetical protein